MAFLIHGIGHIFSWNSSPTLQSDKLVGLPQCNSAFDTFYHLIQYGQEIKYHSLQSQIPGVNINKIGFLNLLTTPYK